MRKLLGVIAAGFLAVGVAGQAQAAALQFTGAVAVQVAVLAPIVLTGAGTAVVNGSGGSGHLTQLQLPASAFQVSGLVLPVTDPAAAPIRGIQATITNAAGTFAGSGGSGFGGIMPLNGSTKVCLFGPCSAAVANIAVPLSPVGVGGVANVTAAVNLTVIGAPWTTGTVAIGSLSAMGGVAPGSNTGAPSGVVNLVTPIFVSTNIAPSAIVPVFGILSLHFVPEPGTLVLLGSGIAGLVAFGRSSRNRK